MHTDFNRRCGHTGALRGLGHGQAFEFHTFNGPPQVVRQLGEQSIKIAARVAGLDVGMRKYDKVVIQRIV